MSDIAARLASVRQRIEQAELEAGRPRGGVRLIAVSKTHPVEAVRAAVAAGQRAFGENRVQDLVAKASEVDAEWHLVGRLQRNKVNDVVGRAALIHSVDRRELAERIGRRAVAVGCVQAVLLQVNVADDPAKGGCRLSDLPDLFTYAAGIDGLRVEGLMTVPPLPPEGQDPAGTAGPAFRRLREALEALRDRHPGLEACSELSMGMSEDLEVAVREGATMVRIGSAVFGPRPAVVR